MQKNKMEATGNISLVCSFIMVTNERLELGVWKVVWQNSTNVYIVHINTLFLRGKIIITTLPFPTKQLLRQILKWQFLTLHENVDIFLQLWYLTKPVVEKQILEIIYKVVQHGDCKNECFHRFA